MIGTFWFVRLDEGEMWKNVVWKWRKCRGKVEEGDGDRNPVCKYYGKKNNLQPPTKSFRCPLTVSQSI